MAYPILISFPKTNFIKYYWITSLGREKPIGNICLHVHSLISSGIFPDAFPLQNLSWDVIILWFNPFATLWHAYNSLESHKLIPSHHNGDSRTAFDLFHFPSISALSLCVSAIFRALFATLFDPHALPAQVFISFTLSPFAIPISFFCHFNTRKQFN